VANAIFLIATCAHETSARGWFGLFCQGLYVGLAVPWG
jgi:hypothetical protein